MPKCSVCGREFPESQLRRCYDCGKAYSTYTPERVKSEYDKVGLKVLL